jgi:hypothetical protein
VGGLGGVPCHDCARIAKKLEDKASLMSLLKIRRDKKRVKYKTPPELMKKLEDIFLDILDVFAELWEGTRHDTEWDEHDVLDFGVLTTSRGKCRPVPVSYKAQLVETSRSQGSLAGNKVAGVLRGLSRAATPRKFRLGKLKLKTNKQRIAATRQTMRAAKSQMKTGHPSTTGRFANDLNLWDRYRYFRSCQVVGKGAKRYSLALDATEVSFKKIMNATISFPNAKVHLWLPPMDIAGPLKKNGLDFELKQGTGPGLARWAARHMGGGSSLGQKGCGPYGGGGQLVLNLGRLIFEKKGLPRKKKWMLSTT